MPNEAAAAATSRMQKRTGQRTGQVRARARAQPEWQQADTQATSCPQVDQLAGARGHERLCNLAAMTGISETSETRNKRQHNGRQEDFLQQASTSANMKRRRAGPPKRRNLMRTRMSRPARDVARSQARLLSRRQAASLALGTFALLLLAAGRLSGGLAAGSGSGSGSAGRLKSAELEASGLSSRRTVQLMRSADVELTRRSLQRQQRDAASPAAESSPLVGPAGQAGATCGYPGSPAHASVTFNTSLVVAGTAASYTCDNGYELLGPPRRICQANGTWSPVGIPFCGK